MNYFLLTGLLFICAFAYNIYLIPLTTPYWRFSMSYKEYYYPKLRNALLFLIGANSLFSLNADMFGAATVEKLLFLITFLCIVPLFILWRGYTLRKLNKKPADFVPMFPLNTAEDVYSSDIVFYLGQPGTNLEEDYQYYVAIYTESGETHPKLNICYHYIVMHERREFGRDTSFVKLLATCTTSYDTRQSLKKELGIIMSRGYVIEYQLYVYNMNHPRITITDEEQLQKAVDYVR